MDSRERLRRCYDHEETDRPAVICRRGPPPYDPTYIRLMNYVDDRCDARHSWYGRSLEEKYDVERFTEAYSEDYARETAILRTPAGDLSATWLRGLKGHPGLQQTFFIKNHRDAEAYLSLKMPALTGGNTGAYFAAVRRMGDRGIVDVSLGRNPAGSVVELCGPETFAWMSVTDRDILHALCRRECEKITNTLKFLLANRIGPYFSLSGEEYITPPVHGPADFDDFNLQYDKPIIDLVHAAGGRAYVHCHGSVKKVLGSFLEMGVDVLHPLEPPPMGDITAKEAKEKVRGKICIEGNIQIAQLYESTPEDIREVTEALIKDAFDDRRGLIVCPTATPYIPGKGEQCYAQYRAMIETVLAFT